MFRKIVFTSNLGKFSKFGTCSKIFRKTENLGNRELLNKYPLLR